MSTFARDVTFSLGIVSTRVKLEPVKDGAKKEATAFKMGHDCGEGVYTPINQKKWCGHCDEEVNDTLKLRAVDGGYAAFTADEVKEMKEATIGTEVKKISVTQHNTVDVMRHTQPSGASYYVYSDIRGNDEALGAITEYVKQHPEKTLVSVVCLRSGSEHMARLNYVNDHLVLELLLWPDEITRPRPEENTVREGMVDLLEKVASTVQAPFKPDDYRSTFAEVIAEAEKERMPGSGSVDVSKMPKRLAKKAGGMDLMEAMEAYVAGLPKKR